MIYKETVPRRTDIPLAVFLIIIQDTFQKSKRFFVVFFKKIWKNTKTYQKDRRFGEDFPIHESKVGGATISAKEKGGGFFKKSTRDTEGCAAFPTFNKENRAKSKMTLLGLVISV